MEKKEWFAEWFDTSYYHILYKDRDDSEAKGFIKNLSRFLSLPPKSEVLDLACGKGRHSITLHSLDYKVTGIDLSPRSISEAKKKENNGLHFLVHDMREPIKGRKFHAVFNLFTSFGYFDEISENSRVMDAVNSMLSPNGIFIIDFMNAQRVIELLVEQESKTVDGITFDIQRRYDGQHIFKDISFSDNGKSFSFTERVQGLTLGHFTELLNANDFEILRTFGDFDLNDFDPKLSDRLILIAQKK